MSENGLDNGDSLQLTDKFKFLRGYKTATSKGERWVTLGELQGAIGGGDFENPMTAAGDIIVGGTAGAPARLAAGTDGQVLTLESGTPAWAAASSGMANPMTTQHDIIVGGASGTPARLAKGTDGQVLKMVSGALAYANADAVKDISTQTYTILNADQGMTIFFTYAGTVTITCPQSLADTVHVTCVPVGATTKLTFAAGSGATLNSKGGLLSVNEQYGVATAIHRGSNAWYVFGNLE